MSLCAAIRFQIRNILRSPQLKYAILVGLISLVAIFCQGLLLFWGHDTHELPSAAIGWMGNYENMQTYLWGYSIAFLLPVLGCSLGGDVVYRDLKYSRFSPITIRMGRRSYILSAAIVTFTSTFLFVLAYQVLSQLMAFLIYPVTTDVDAFQSNFLSTSADAGGALTLLRSLPFGPLAEINLYLFNFAYMLYDAAYLASLSLLAYSISLYLRKSGLLIITIPTALIIILTQALPSRWNPIVNMTMTISHGSRVSLFHMLIAPVAIMLVAVVAITLSEFVMKSDLW